MHRPVVIEIAVQDASGARAALAAGADRLELCQALEAGGLTPSWGLIDRVLDAVDPGTVNVLVRPRAGGFVYDAEEVALVSADIREIVRRGAAGVVVGALTADGAVDRSTLSVWREVAGGAVLTFHRAIDAARDPLAVLAQLHDLGVDRVLTSGGARSAADGADVLESLAAAARSVEIMAGGGVAPGDIGRLASTGVDAIHLSARARAGREAPSGPGGGTTGHDVTDPALVAAAVAAARQAAGPAPESTLER